MAWTQLATQSLPPPIVPALVCRQLCCVVASYSLVTHMQLGLQANESDVSNFDERFTTLVHGD